MLWQHGHEFEGKKPIGYLTELDPGGYYEAAIFNVPTPETSCPPMDARLVGVSYSARGATRAELKRDPPQSEHNPQGLPEVTLRDVHELKEISIVVRPADPHTSAWDRRDPGCPSSQYAPAPTSPPTQPRPWLG